MGNLGEGRKSVEDNDDKNIDRKLKVLKMKGGEK